MVNELALVTGSTGFIGSRVVIDLLKAGYTVRLAIRRQEQAENLLKLFSQYADASRISFVIVPDITVTGAFDEAVKDVQYVLHLASPIPGGGEDMLRPAVRGTVSILESALKEKSIKKVVVTASVASLMPVGGPEDGGVITERTDVELNISPEEIKKLDPMSQYMISKIASYKATIDFVNEQKPPFDVVTIHPVFVYGRNPLQTRADQLAGSNGSLFKSLVSEKPLLGQFLGVHVDDVAAAHVKALDGGITGFRQYLLSAGRWSWSDVERFVREKYPDLPFLLKGVDTADYRADGSKAERELGVVYKGMEVQVSDVVDQQVELGVFP